MRKGMMGVLLVAVAFFSVGVYAQGAGGRSVT